MDDEGTTLTEKPTETEEVTGGCVHSILLFGILAIVSAVVIWIILSAFRGGGV